MKPDYKNWIPKGMIFSLITGTALSLALLHDAEGSLPPDASRLNIVGRKKINGLRERRR